MESMSAFTDLPVELWTDPKFNFVLNGFDLADRVRCTKAATPSFLLGSDCNWPNDGSRHTGTRPPLGASLT
jgi:hypothetical protein